MWLITQYRGFWNEITFTQMKRCMCVHVYFPVKLYRHKTKKVAWNFTPEFYLIYTSLNIDRYVDYGDWKPGLLFFLFHRGICSFSTLDEIIVTSFHFSFNPQLIVMQSFNTTL